MTFFLNPKSVFKVLPYFLNEDGITYSVSQNSVRLAKTTDCDFWKHFMSVYLSYSIENLTFNIQAYMRDNDVYYEYVINIDKAMISYHEIVFKVFNFREKEIIDQGCWY